jgi:acetyltransferase-like isoleucine patch superfamily enzyme
MAFDYTRLRCCGVDVRIADTVVIKHPELVSIGDHVAIDDFVVITTAADIGDYVHISQHCTIIGGAKSTCVLQRFSGLSAGCRIICGSDDYLGSGLTNPTIPPAFRADLRFTTVTLEPHALLGTNCVCHPGVTVHEGAVAGSCSLITRDLAAWVIHIGVPARALKARQRDRMLELQARLVDGHHDGR